MKTRKSFDCVQMKWELQQALLHRFAGLDPKEIRDGVRGLIEADGELSSFLKQVREVQPAASSPASGG